MQLPESISYWCRWRMLTQLLTFFLQRLWIPSLEHYWHHGVWRNQKALQALRCSSTLSWKGFLGQVPLFLCFLDGNPILPLQNNHGKRQIRGVEFGRACGPCPGSRRGHENRISPYFWNFGRSPPRVSGLSVATAEKICKRCRSAAAISAWETRRARKRSADAEMWHVYTSHKTTCQYKMLCVYWCQAIDLGCVLRIRVLKLVSCFIVLFVCGKP